MKAIKRIVSAILCATLLFTVAIPAFAADEPSLMPVITKQPHDMAIEWSQRHILVSPGLTAEVESGDPLGYKLYLGNKLIEEKGLPTVSGALTPGEYHYVIYNRANPQYEVTSESFTIEVINKPPFFERLMIKLESLKVDAVLLTMWVAVPMLLMALFEPVKIIGKIFGML